MSNILKPEVETIHYQKMRHVHVSLNHVLFRNMHEHSAFEVDVILDGTARIRAVDGEFIAHPGDVVLFNPYAPHEISTKTTEALQLLSLQISDRFCQDYYPRFQNLEFGACDMSGLLSEDERQKLREMIFSAALAFYQEEDAFQFDCIGKICRLLTELLRKLPYAVIADAEYLAREKRTNRIRRIVAYIDRHYTEKISLAALAEAEGVTLTHLSHFFSETFQTSFREYLNSLRLEKALALMKDPGLRMVDICMECGFSSNRYLNQVFLKEFGCSAMEYRRRCQNLREKTLESKAPISYSEFRHGPEESVEILRKHLGDGRYEDLAVVMI